MSKKSKKKNNPQGTYALCITVGLVVGAGIGPLMGSVPLMAVIGGLAGAAAGYAFTQRKPPSRRH